MKIYNTLTKKIEKFESMKDREVGMYTCGPTVYDTAHIGNLRKYTCDDLLYRTLKFNGYNVKRVMNITDIDDKTINKSGGDHKKFDELTKMYEESFFADLDKLNITKPLPENITRATQYIEKMVLFIEDLLNKGYAYKGTDGSIYFSIEKFKNYGELAGLDRDNLKAGARVSQDEYTKENPADFALWKAWDTADGEIYWETRLGKGRPGWHIECSAMSMDKLGETIDIHTGGVDNIFPHHENEIAQSEARSGKKFVNFWVHNEHLMVDGKKMSKSAGNFYRLKDIEEKGFSPLDFRYFMIGAHYRSKVNFTWEGLESAKNTRERLMRIIEDLPKEDGKIAQEYLDSFKEKVSNDLNISEALAVLWSLLRDEKIPAEDKRITAIEMDAVLGLDLGKEKNIEIPAEIVKLAKERKIARENKDFKASDDLRDKINSLGWQIEDLAGNQYRIEKNNG
jgi:cysteinyl-tRNA synthetase